MKKKMCNYDLTPMKFFLMTNKISLLGAPPPSKSSKDLCFLWVPQLKRQSVILYPGRLLMVIIIIINSNTMRTWKCKAITALEA